MKEIIEKITQWANDRNLIEGSTPLKQGLKLMSEYGELCDAIAKNDIDGIKDGIGDVGVVAIIITAQHGVKLNTRHFRFPKRFTNEMVIDLSQCLAWLVSNTPFPELAFLDLSAIARRYNLTLEQCLEHAYNEIKDRKGIMYNGVFVKDTDPSYPDIVAEVNK